jgi:hypothetical protein
MKDKLAFKEELFSPDAGLPVWWAALYERVKNPSIFLSPQWVQAWLEIYGADFKGKVLSWWFDDLCVAGGLLLFRPAKRGPFPIRFAILNTAGEIDENAPFIEYNDVLCLPGYEEVVTDSLGGYLADQAWDRLYLAGYAAESVLASLGSRALPGKWDSLEKNSPYIDLTALKENGLDGYLSSNTRSQIRRSIKLYESRGELQFNVAKDLNESIQYLDVLARLHRAAWDRRGAAGGFRASRFIQFHKTLVERLLPVKAVELVRVTVGEQDIGYLYNFLSHGKVYFYQSGFAFEEDSKIKPGLVTHYLAVKHYCARGLKEYDFMAGDARYKKSLAKSNRKLYWSWVDRGNAKMKLIGLAVKVKRLLRGGYQANRGNSDKS